MKTIYFLLTVILISACTTAPKPVEEKPLEPVYPIPTEAVTEETQIDLSGLQTSLGMDREPQDLGYQEKAFDTCQVGYGFSRSQNCRRAYLVTVNFRLLCRDSEGTISTMLTESDLQPIADRSIAWTLKGARGTIQTDGQGYGQIRATSNKSPKGERLRLAAGPEFLYMRAGEITRVVTPLPWCAR